MNRPSGKTSLKPKTLLEKQLARRPWLADAWSAIAGVVFLVQSWISAHTRDSVLDEGVYLLKGYLFASGEYQPFQANGVLTNHMPLSFLIPGWFQYLFGPGLQTGRYYAVFISLMFFLGAWVLTRKLGGRWWAAVVACFLATNPMMIKVYSLAVSQGLVACLLVWILVFALGQERSLWQVCLGSFLAGVLLITRLNMAVVLPLLLVYIYWQHGAYKGFLAIVCGFIPVLWAHLHFYPGIMVLWAKWLPPGLTPFLSSWRFEGLNQIPGNAISSIVRLKALFQGVFLHFVPLMAILVSWILWSPKKGSPRTKIVFFASVLYGTLFALHTWATLGGTHCVFCFSWYQYFFEIVAILLPVMTWQGWKFSLSPWKRAFSWGCIVLITLGLVIGTAFQLGGGKSANFDGLVDEMLKMPVPRFEDWRFEPGRIEFWGLIANKFGLVSRYGYETAYQRVELGTRLAFSLVLIGVTLLVLWWIAGWMQKWIMGRLAGHRNRNIDRSAAALLLFLVLGWVLTPMGVLGKNRDSYDCGFNVIATYEAAGNQLAEQIPVEAKVFWRGGDTQATLLYLRDPNFYPALFNAGFANRKGDSKELERHGLWNDELIQVWAQEADVILIEARNYGGWLAEYVTSGEFNELETTGEVGCRGGTNIHVYLRTPNRK